MKFALWLMNRFHVDSSLTGDLTEEWAAGRSVRWLVWQTGVAILSALWVGIWHHKFRTLAAVAIGLLGWDLLLFVFTRAIYAVGLPDFPVGVLLFGFRPVLLGWIVGRLQPRQPLGTALLFIATTMAVALWFSRHSLDYRFLMLFGSWLIVTTTVGGVLAARKAKSFPILNSDQ